MKIKYITIGLFVGLLFIQILARAATDMSGISAGKEGIIAQSINGYNYASTNTAYTSYFKSNSNWGDGIKYCVNDTGTEKCLTYQSQDYSYRDKFGGQDYISSINGVLGTVSGNKITYISAFPNVSIEYTVSSRVLKENYILYALPKTPAASLTAPVTLDFGGYIKYGDLDLYVDNVKVTGTSFITNKSIQFRSGANTLFWLPEPYAMDSANASVLLQYEVKKQGNSMWFYVRTPYTWLADPARVFPIYIDPTTDTVAGVSDDSNNMGNTNVWSQNITASASGTLTSIGIDFHQTTGVDCRVAVAIYSDSGSHAPNALLMSNVSHLPDSTSGFYDFPIGNVSIVAGTEYWTALNWGGGGCTSMGIHEVTAGTPCKTRTAAWEGFGAMPDPYGAATNRILILTRMTYEAAATPADTNTSLYLNGTEGNRTYVQYGIANFTGLVNVTGAITLNSTYSTFSNQSGNSPLSNTTLNLTTTGTNIPISVYFYGNATFNPSNTTWYFNVTAFVKNDTNMSLYLNGTEGNRTYTQYTIANFTARVNTSGTIYLNSSYSAFANQSGASPLQNSTINLTATGTNVPIEAWFFDNGVFKPSNKTWYFTVTAPTTTTTTLPSNDTIINVYENTYVLVEERCINASFISRSYEYTATTDGTPSTYVFDQTYNCTHGCLNDVCAATSPDTDMTSMWVICIIGIVLLVLGTVQGIPYGKLVGKEDIKGRFDTTMMVRYVFFFVGFYLMYLSLGMATGIESTYGGSPNAIGGTNAATMAITIVSVLFLFIFVIEVFFVALQFLGTSTEKGRFENE